ncbi:hypothetical protein [Candidatus Venteria ishoeyi]|uniref:Glycosyltransferase subfamily 4-like N-terminal domain-containing protein n=1 Tax=Candidatus Venteria ishoeyi TaxID=1899563 RepID=A0A1H6F603_9GAMM|nr:hypothetical protein [Candidatus Venteria ishoeyi]SEH05542.1 Uncharacterised protein [Candidatus Venteria ishoeyi]
MKVLHISTSDSGGAGIAALRIHKEMLINNINSTFLCLNKTSDIANVIQFPKFYPRFYHRLLSKLGLPLTQVEKQTKKQKKLKKIF